MQDAQVKVEIHDDASAILVTKSLELVRGTLISFCTSTGAGGRSSWQLILPRGTVSIQTDFVCSALELAPLPTSLAPLPSPATLPLHRN